MFVAGKTHDHLDGAQSLPNGLVLSATTRPAYCPALVRSSNGAELALSGLRVTRPELHQYEISTSRSCDVQIRIQTSMIEPVQWEKAYRIGFDPN
jgi:hypothetical protein